VVEGAAFDFRLLGPIEVVVDGQSLPVEGPRLRALLAILLLHANRVVSRDRLIDDLWGEDPPASAVNALQVHVSHLRSALAGADRVVRLGPGYRLNLTHDELDLHRFEDAWSEARQNLKAGEARQARDQLVAALALWRGEPLTEFGERHFADAEAHRLAEMHLAALGDRIDAELALGLHHEVVGELDALVRSHPLQERPLAQLMLALYRCGRQVDALHECDEARRRLLDEFGLSLGPDLQRLERAILQQDAELEVEAAARPAAALRTVLLASQTSDGLAELVALCAPMAAARSGRELLLARVVSGTAPGESAAALTAAGDDLSEQLRRLHRSQISARAAVFTSIEVADDVLRLAGDQTTRLILLDAGGAFDAGVIGDPAAGVLAAPPCDVGLVVSRAGRRPGAGSGVLVPFGGTDHDWAALELGCWLARAVSAPLRLLGPIGGGDGRGDASRTLAAASLAVQRAHQVVPEPVLVSRGADGLVAATPEGRALVIGVGERWQRDGLGDVRRALTERSACPVILVRRGLRPSGLAPAEAITRFTWSLATP